MCTLHFTLKQHTPIIHFQHDQTGATLRATEVKPKLDKYIRRALLKEANKPFDVYVDKDFKVVSNDCKEKKEYIDDELAFVRAAKTNKDWAKWLIDPDRGALNYKMRIEPVSVKILDIQKEKLDDKGKIKIKAGKIEVHPSPAFFGNQGKKDLSEFKKGTFTDEDIDIFIFCIHKELGVDISKHFSDFIFQTNFGTRQSKGFGSFSVIRINGIATIFPKNVYKYKFSLTISGDKWEEDYKKISESIDYFYRTLRSGINIVGTDQVYFKSALYMYLSNKTPTIQWDKKTIKGHFLNYGTCWNGYTQKKDQQHNYVNTGTKFTIKYLPQQAIQHTLNEITPKILLPANGQDEKFSLKNYRDLFGLSSNESWHSYRGKLEKVQAEKIGTSWKSMHKDKVEIHRYKSPILFKPIISGNMATIYFDVFERAEVVKYIGIPFIYSMDFKGMYNPKLPKTSFKQLVLPIAKNFDFDDFLDWTFKNINVKAHLVLKSTKPEHLAIKNLLIKIYSELKTPKTPPTI
jgi:hypothetical protein